MACNEARPGGRTSLDFDVEIGPGTGGDYPVTSRWATGEQRASMHLAAGDADLGACLDSIRNDLREPGDLAASGEPAVCEVGDRLFRALLGGDLLAGYDTARQEAELGGQSLRLRLRIVPSELAVLPWEYLCDTRRGEPDYPARTAALVRGVVLPHAEQPLAVDPPLRIVGMVGSPGKRAALERQRTRQRLEDALKGVQRFGLATVEWVDGGSLRDLQRALRAGSWHVFHFIGQSAPGAGALILTDRQGRMQELDAAGLGGLLAGQSDLRLVVLSAGDDGQGEFAPLAADLLERGIPAVLVLPYAIEGRTAAQLYRTFYETLAEGYPVDAALTDARRAAGPWPSNTIAWGAAALYLGSTDGLLFRMPGAVPPATDALGVEVSPREITMDAGGAATFQVTVRNHGDEAFSCTVRLVGIPEQWGTAMPAELAVPPFGSVTDAICISPPRAPSSRADAYSWTIVIAGAGAEVQTQVTTTVNPYHALGLDELAPDEPAVTAGGYAETTLAIANEGNTTVMLRLAGEEVTGVCSFAFQVPEKGTGQEDMAQLSLAAGEVARVPIRISVVQRQRLRLRAQHVPFRIHVAAEGVDDLACSVDGRLVIPANFLTRLGRN
jgi:hypothetical protein